MKKKNLSKMVFIILVLVLILTFCAKRSRSYERTYEVDDRKVKEMYDSDTEYYSFSIDIDDVEYQTLFKSKFIGEKLAGSLKIYEKDDITCTLVEGEKIDAYPVCTKNGQYTDYWQLEDMDDFYEKDEVKKVNFSYEGVSFSSIMDKSYLIWNYRGYYYVRGDERKSLEFLEKESYYNNLSYRMDRYVITANYDQEYEFDQFFIIDMKTGKQSTWKLQEKLSYNSYFLGDKNGIIYMVDRKAKKEFALDPKRKKLERIDKGGMGKVWSPDSEEVSMTKLVSDDFYFEEDNDFSSKMDDGKLLYGNTSYVASSRKVDKIVEDFKDEVFYLVGEELYSYSPRYGENAILKYSELNFNSTNFIFIY